MARVEREQYKPLFSHTLNKLKNGNNVATVTAYPLTLSPSQQPSFPSRKNAFTWSLLQNKFDVKNTWEAILQMNDKKDSDIRV